ncbi:MAG TPA: hypothetical protein VGI39_37595 [Polyangiaceae bacterium]
MTTCIECGKTCPTHTSEKLTALGWRVIMKPTDNGSVSQWRCAACWGAFKSAAGMPSLPPPPSVARKRAR